MGGIMNPVDLIFYILAGFLGLGLFWLSLISVGMVGIMIKACYNTWKGKI